MLRYELSTLLEKDSEEEEELLTLLIRLDVWIFRNLHALLKA